MPRYKVGSLHVLAEQRVLYQAGNLIALPPKAFDILLVLVEHAGSVVTRDKLHAEVWGESFVEDTNLSKNISILRTTLRQHLGGEEAIRTLSKRGYQLVIPVHVDELAGGRTEASVRVPAIPVDLPSIELPTADLQSWAGAPAAALPGQNRSAMGVVAGAAASRGALAGQAPHRRWWLAGIGITVVGVVGWLSHVQGAQRGVSAEVGAQVRPSLAVLQFRNLSEQPDKDWLGVALQESIATDLARNDGVRLIADDRTAQAERDLGASPARPVDDATLRSLGGLLECRMALSGSYLPLGHEVRVDLQLRDMATGAVISQYTETTSDEKLLGVLATATTQLRAAMKLPGDRANGGNSGTMAAGLGPDAPGQQEYAEGLRLSRAGDSPVKAREMFSRAVAADPQQPLFHQGLAQVWKTLGFEVEAAHEAQLALATAEGSGGMLSRESRLSLQASSYALTGERPRAIEALTQLRRQYPDEGEYALRLAVVEIDAGKLKEAGELLEQLRQPGSVLAADPRVALAQAKVAGSRGDAKAELLAAGVALQQAEARGQRSLAAYALLFEGQAWSQLGDGGRSLAQLHRSEDLYAQLGDEGGVSSALVAEAIAEQKQHDPQAEASIERSIAIAERIGYRRTEAAATMQRGSLQLAAGQNGHAEASYQKALALAQEAGLRDLTMRAAGNLVLPALYERDMPKALHYSQQALALANADGATEMIAYATHTLANIEISTGRLNEGEAHLRQALALARPLGDKSKVGAMLYELAGLQMERGDLAGAQATLAGIDRGSLSARYVPLVQMAQADLAIEQDRPQQAIAALAALAAENPGGAAPMLDEIAEAQLRLGHTAEAGAAAAKALALDKATPASRSDLLDARLMQARVELASGDTAAAARQLPALLVEARSLQRPDAVLAIRTAQGELQQRQGSAALGRQTLTAVATDANRAGFVLIARHASQAIGR